jgi:hypothetical protein
MRHTTQSQPLGAILTGIIMVPLLLTPATTAGAGGSSDREESRIQPAREILTEVEKSDSGASWLRTHIHVRKKRGIEYSQPFTMASRQLVLNIHGPAMSRKRLGLGFEVRFAPRR